LFEQTFQKFPKPHFFIGVLEGAVHEASTKQKPLLVYIHDHNDGAKIQKFVENTISNPEAIKLLVLIPNIPLIGQRVHLLRR